MPTPRTLAGPHDRLKALSGFGFWTLGQAELLAGINLAGLDLGALGTTTEDQVAGALDHCARITLRRVWAGELCLVTRTHLYGRG